MQPWDEGCRRMSEDENVSPYIRKSLKSTRTEAQARRDIAKRRGKRALCPRCNNHPAQDKTGVCESCYLDAQANVVDLTEERAFRHVLKIVEGEE